MDATKCLELDPTFVKGYYRRGMEANPLVSFLEIFIRTVFAMNPNGYTASCF
jgi:hypothetical protein